MDFSKIPDGYEDGKAPLTFYYNREERLKNAPKNVKDYYEGKFTAFKPGLFKALVATKANRFILFALVICFAVVIFNIFFGPKSNVETYKGIPMNLTAFSYNEQIFVSLKIDNVEKKYRGVYENGIPITVKFTLFDVDNEIIVLSEETLLSDSDLYKGKEFFFRSSFDDFDVSSIVAEISLLDRVEDKKINLKAKVDKR